MFFAIVLVVFTVFLIVMWTVNPVRYSVKKFLVKHGMMKCPYAGETANGGNP